MVNHLIRNKKLVTIVLSAILLVLLGISLIFGDAEDRTALLVSSLVIPIVVYGFIRLMFKVCRINAPHKYLKLMVRFFLIAAILGLAVMRVGVVPGVPNGLSVALPACMAVIIAALDEEEKNNQTQNDADKEKLG